MNYTEEEMATLFKGLTVVVVAYGKILPSKLLT